MESTVKVQGANSPYLAPLVAGALAGISVEVTLYPLDTLTTRLQAKQGFNKSGGFQGVYKGLPIVASASLPNTALFFMTYEKTKTFLEPRVKPQYAPFAHSFSACVAEVLACIIRVPTEIAKQRKQTNMGGRNLSSIRILIEAYKAEGVRKGLFRGFLSTVARDLPFSFINLPVWELLKNLVRQYNNGQISSLQSALCGCVAGGFAGVATTPLDVAKTRIMLAEEHTAASKLRIRPMLTSIYLESGLRGLFAGVTPRLMGFMLGGFVFFGVYDHAKSAVENWGR